MFGSGQWTFIQANSQPILEVQNEVMQQSPAAWLGKQYLNCKELSSGRGQGGANSKAGEILVKGNSLTHTSAFTPFWNPTKITLNFTKRKDINHKVKENREKKNQ